MSKYRILAGKNSLNDDTESNLKNTDDDDDDVAVESLLRLSSQNIYKFTEEPDSTALSVPSEEKIQQENSNLDVPSLKTSNTEIYEDTSLKKSEGSKSHDEKIYSKTTDLHIALNSENKNDNDACPSENKSQVKNINSLGDDCSKKDVASELDIENRFSRKAQSFPSTKNKENFCDNENNLIFNESSDKETSNNVKNIEVSVKLTESTSESSSTPINVTDNDKGNDGLKITSLPEMCTKTNQLDSTSNNINCKLNSPSSLTDKDTSIPAKEIDILENNDSTNFRSFSRKRKTIEKKTRNKVRAIKRIKKDKIGNEMRTKEGVNFLVTSKLSASKTKINTIKRKLSDNISSAKKKKNKCLNFNNLNEINSSSKCTDRKRNQEVLNVEDSVVACKSNSSINNENMENNSTLDISIINKGNSDFDKCKLMCNNNNSSKDDVMCIDYKDVNYVHTFEKDLAESQNVQISGKSLTPFSLLEELYKCSALCDQCTKTWSDDTLNSIVFSTKVVVVNSRVTYGAVLLFYMWAKKYYSANTFQVMHAIFKKADLYYNISESPLKVLCDWVAFLLSEGVVKCCKTFLKLYHKSVDISGLHNWIYTTMQKFTSVKYEFCTALLKRIDSYRINKTNGCDFYEDSGHICADSNENIKDLISGKSITEPKTDSIVQPYMDEGLILKGILYSSERGTTDFKKPIQKKYEKNNIQSQCRKKNKVDKTSVCTKLSNDQAENYSKPLKANTTDNDIEKETNALVTTDQNKSEITSAMSECDNVEVNLQNYEDLIECSITTEENCETASECYSDGLREPLRRSKRRCVALATGNVLTNDDVSKGTNNINVESHYLLVMNERQKLDFEVNNLYAGLSYDDNFITNLDGIPCQKYTINREILELMQFCMNKSDKPSSDLFYKSVVQLLLVRGKVLLIPDSFTLMQHGELLEKNYNQQKNLDQATNFEKKAWDKDKIYSTEMFKFTNVKEGNPTVREILSLFCLWKNLNISSPKQIQKFSYEKCCKLLSSQLPTDILKYSVSVYAKYCHLAFNNNADNGEVILYLDQLLSEIDTKLPDKDLLRFETSEYALNNFEMSKKVASDNVSEKNDEIWLYKLKKRVLDFEDQLNEFKNHNAVLAEKLQKDFQKEKSILNKFSQQSSDELITKVPMLLSRLKKQQLVENNMKEMFTLFITEDQLNENCDCSASSAELALTLLAHKVKVKDMQFFINAICENFFDSAITINLPQISWFESISKAVSFYPQSEY